MTIYKDEKRNVEQTSSKMYPTDGRSFITRKEKKNYFSKANHRKANIENLCIYQSSMQSV